MASSEFTTRNAWLAPPKAGRLLYFGNRVKRAFQPRLPARAATSAVRRRPGIRRSGMSLLMNKNSELQTVNGYNPNNYEFVKTAYI